MALLACAASGASAASRGDLDPSFGSGGQLPLEIGFPTAQINDLVVQSDGKTVLVGSTAGPTDASDFLVVRLNPDGSLDPTFGSGGIATTDFNHFQDGASAVTIAPDGKIVVGGFASDLSGTGNRDQAVVRYEADGTPDPTFSGDGKQTVDFGGGSEGAQAIALQPDGKVLLAGSANPSGTEIDFGIARLDSDGEPDTTFSGDAKQAADLGSANDAVRQIAVQPDGKIVALGYTTTPSALHEFALARYDSNGELDTTFSDDGTVTNEFLAGGTSEPNGLALLPDGKILASGFTGIEFEGFEFVLARYDNDGELDQSFSEDGLATAGFEPGAGVEPPLPPESFAVAGLSLAPDGTAFQVGSFRYFEEDFTEHEEIGVAAFRPDGSLDDGFTGDGRETIAFEGKASPAVSGLDSKGRLVLAGTVAEEPTSRFVVMRLFGLEPPTEEPGPPPPPPLTGPGQSPPAVGAPAAASGSSVACRRATAGLRVAGKRVAATGKRLSAARRSLARTRKPRQKLAAKRSLRSSQIRFENSKKNRDRASRKAAARC